MSVDVTLLPATVPERFRDEDISRIRPFEDITGESPVSFQYALHGGGSLVIWRVPDEGTPEVEAAFGPSAWEEVQGDLYMTPR